MGCLHEPQWLFKQYIGRDRNVEHEGQRSLVRHAIDTEGFAPNRRDLAHFWRSNVSWTVDIITVSGWKYAAEVVDWGGW